MRKQSNQKDSRIPEDGRYVHGIVRVTISGLPAYGDNNSLIYEWRLQHGLREEKGRAQHYVIGRGCVDTEDVREQVAASVIRVCCKEYLGIDCAWKKPRKYVSITKM